jgi:hypothetical protein
MKHIKEFNSFQLNEGLFDKVKGWFKGDKEEEPVGQKPSISAMKNNSTRPTQRPDVTKPKVDKEKPVGQPKQISNDQWREKLREYGVKTLGKCSSWTSGGIVPFTNKEINFLEEWKLKGRDKKKLYTWDNIKAELYINYKIKITKLDDSCYLIYFNDIPAGDINEMGDEDSLEQEFTKCFICDRWEEVVEYLKNVRYMFNTFTPNSFTRQYN